MTEETPEVSRMMPAIADLGTTASGLKPTHAALFAYSFGLLSGLLFFFTEKENRFVRFHAMQSICTSVGFFIMSLVLATVPLLGYALVFCLQLGALVVWLILMVKAFQGQWFRLPVAGDVAAKQAGI